MWTQVEDVAKVSSRSKVPGAEYLGRFRFDPTKQVWCDAASGEEREPPERDGCVFGCYEVSAGIYDVYAEPTGRGGPMQEKPKDTGLIALSKEDKQPKTNRIMRFGLN